MSCNRRKLELRGVVRQALAEDIGTGDITTRNFIAPHKTVEAVILAKEDFVVCGLFVAACVFKTRDKNVRFKAMVAEGRQVKAGEILARIYGRAESILTYERVALNFLSFLSGITTKTRKFIEAVKPYKAKILDTRKTIPGLRLLEKYAVRIGGGFNHRFSLDEMIILKDNHLRILNSRDKIQNFDQMMKKLRKKMPQKMKIEIEVKNLREFRSAMKLNPDAIMLDNMKVKEIKRAVQLRSSLIPNPTNPFPKLEASGGISLKNVRQVAATGVDMISVGALTHSVSSVDISLEIIT